jgi:hypothetical protein
LIAVFFLLFSIFPLFHPFFAAFHPADQLPPAERDRHLVPRANLRRFGYQPLFFP